MVRRLNGARACSREDARAPRVAHVGELALLLLSFLATALALPRTARADQPGAHTVPVAVLAFDSDDAEEQADSVTGALRSRIRAAQGWSLIETTQSLGMLTAALKCPSRPPPECQQKIAEHIKAERYVFGWVTKGPTAGLVTAEIHLYQKGKPDTLIKESYAENLKDSNDDALRKVAARAVERLGGAAVGVVVVKSADKVGEVIVDGEKHVALGHGTARIELAAGGHAIELAPANGTSTKRNVLVAAGRETVVEFGTTVRVEPPSQESRGQTRKLVGGATIGVGAVLGTIAVVQLVRYFGLQSDGEAAAAKLDKNDPKYGPLECREYNPACIEIDKDAKIASGLALGLGAGSAVALGVGAYLFFGAPAGSEKSASKTTLVPRVGAGSGSLVVVGSF